jgi:hypothetical protein
MAVFGIDMIAAVTPVRQAPEYASGRKSLLRTSPETPRKLRRSEHWAGRCLSFGNANFEMKERWQKN